MGKSLRSKRMRRNRREKRVVNGPRVKAKLINALNFEYNEQTEKAHLSIFHEAMNGPPPAVPGLEPGSKLERTHLTVAHQTHDEIKGLLQRRSNRKIAEAVKALTGVTSLNPECKRDKALLDEMEARAAREAEKLASGVVRVYDPKTNRDQFGNYPEWMNSKKVRSKAHANKVQRKKMRKRLAKGKAPLNNNKEQNDSENSGESDMECEPNLLL
ncbi:uncharacterized protein LOC117653290 [Thrips palmi]|uniref:Uncharacterized protein LOC117653290 n=1 Tax=Thrips palmi TaxID=161013 RepID=A0A6P9ABJ6_THRPL|nr:uncharacterized protein LOC117653290 [Thrips palmi]